MNDKERSAKMENRDCEKILDLINQYIDGELNEDDAEFVRAHIDNCPDCKKAYDELSKIEKMFENAAEEAPAELCEAVMTKIKSEKTARKIRFTKMFGGIAVAAAISLTVLASPAILMVATGGAKANDMAEALSPSRGEADNYFSADGSLTECETVIVNSSDSNGKSETYQEVMDAIEDVKKDLEDKISDTTVSQGKKYTAYLSDGSETALILTQDIAILGGVEYEYEISGNQYILKSGSDVLIFDSIRECPDDEVFFKQTEQAND